MKYPWFLMRFAAIASILVMTFVPDARSQTITTEDFEMGLPTTAPSTETNYALKSGSWSLLRALQNGSNKHGGAYALALSSGSNPTAYATTPPLNTIASVSFWARGGGASTMTLLKSVDGGPFTTLASQAILSSYAQYTIVVNESGKNVRIRFQNGAGTTHYIDDLTITSVLPNTISLSSASLSSFGNILAGDSSGISSYTVSGASLTGSIQVTATAGFRIGTDSMSLGSIVTLVPSDGTVTPTTVYVRFTPADATGTVEATVVHTSTDAPTQYLAVNGVSIAAEPTMQGAVSVGSITGTGAALTLTAGNGTGRIVVLRPGASVTFNPMDGVAYSGASANVSAARDLGDGNRLVYDGSGTTVNLTGLAPGTAYACAVFEYGTGAGNSQNYRSIVPGVVTWTTLAVPGIVVQPSALAFGNVVINQNSVEKSFKLSGQFLSPEAGTIDVVAPAGFSVSLSTGTGFVPSLSIPYSGGLLGATTIYLLFQPTSIQSYDGTVSVTGGSAIQQSVTVTGSGSNQVIAAEQPVGFASLNGGVTGGKGGVTTTVTTESELKALMDNNAPQIIYISGTIDLGGNNTLRSNKTLIGLGTDARLINGGLEMNSYQNIIIRNITFENAPDDCFKVNNASGNIWVDHCTFLDGPVFDPNSGHDGLFDITRQSDFITISWCLFYNHSKTMLIGHSDGASSDAGYLRTTIHHNWFKGTLQRHPRVRFGNVHTFNNFYDGNGIYGVASACNAYVVVEGSYFKGVPSPIHVGYDDSPWGFVNESGNIYESSGTPVTDGRTGFKGVPVSNPHTWNPSSEYSYTLDNAAEVPAIVMANAGAGKIATNVEEGSVDLPTGISLLQNFPNPFNPSTNFEIRLPDSKVQVGQAGSSKFEFVRLSIFDLLGREVAVLVNDILPPGSYRASWNAAREPSGVYFAVLSSGGHSVTRKLVLAK